MAFPRGRADNPFVVQRLGPDGTPWRTIPGLEPEALIDAARAHGGHLELMGPHGVGKSTLLRAIMAALEARGAVCRWWQCSDVRPNLPARWPLDLLAADHVFIDGCERCHPWQWAMARRLTRLLGRGLFVTSHARLGVGLLVEVRANADAFAQVVSDLMGYAFPPSEAARRLDESGGSMREAFDRLYTEWEATGAVAGVEPPVETVPR